MTTMTTSSYTAVPPPQDDQDQPQGTDFKLGQAIIDAATAVSEAGSWATQTDAAVVDYYTESENNMMIANNAALDAQVELIDGNSDSTDAEEQETIYNNMSQKSQAAMESSNSAISQENTALSDVSTFTSGFYSSMQTVINGLNSITNLISHLN